MVSCQSISPFSLVIKPISHDHHSIMLSMRTLNFQLDHFVWLALGWAWLLGFTRDVPPWGRSVHPQTDPMTIRQAHHFSLVNAVMLHLPCLPPSKLWLSPSPLFCLLACNPASFFTRNIGSITQSDLALPLPSAAAHPPPSCSLAFSPPTNQVCLVSMPHDPATIFSGNLHKNLPLFFPAPSQLYFPKWCLNNHEFFFLKINPVPPRIYQPPTFKLNFLKWIAPCFLFTVLTHTLLTRQRWQPITLLKQPLLCSLELSISQV